MNFRIGKTSSSLRPLKKNSVLHRYDALNKCYKTDQIFKNNFV